MASTWQKQVMDPLALKAEKQVLANFLFLEKPNNTLDSECWCFVLLQAEWLK